MISKSKWHRGNRSKRDGLTQMWKHEDGYLIYQGRINNGSLHFVYRRYNPDGTQIDYEFLTNAKIMEFKYDESE